MIMGLDPNPDLLLMNVNIINLDLVTNSFVLLLLLLLLFLSGLVQRLYCDCILIG
jgi:hypothetical protein